MIQTTTFLKTAVRLRTHDVTFTTFSGTSDVGHSLPQRASASALTHGSAVSKKQSAPIVLSDNDVMDAETLPFATATSGNP